MRIFISWSGERSQSLAQALHEWLPLVLHFVEPWVSQSDINAGDRWANEVAKELEASKFGIICVTSENLSSPWILFEAGALSKSMQEGRVVPLLFDIEFKDITGPMAQFQAKKLEVSGLSDVIAAINRCSSTPVPDPRLRPLFDALWPELEKKVGEIPKAPKQSKPSRPQQEILEELVSSIRHMDGRFREVVDELPRARRRRRLHPGMIDEIMGSFDLGRNDPLRLLLLGSLIREDIPWLHELAMEAYREAVHGTRTRAQTARHRFLVGLKVLRFGPLLDMYSHPDKDTHFWVREMTHMLENEFLFHESAPAARGTSERNENKPVE